MHVGLELLERHVVVSAETQDDRGEFRELARVLESRLVEVLRVYFDACAIAQRREPADTRCQQASREHLHALSETRVRDKGEIGDG